MDVQTWAIIFTVGIIAVIVGYAVGRDVGFQTGYRAGGDDEHIYHEFDREHSQDLS